MRFKLGDKVIVNSKCIYIYLIGIQMVIREVRHCAIYPYKCRIYGNEYVFSERELNLIDREKICKRKNK